MNKLYFQAIKKTTLILLLSFVNSVAQNNLWNHIGPDEKGFNGKINVVYTDANNNIYAGGTFSNNDNHCFVAKWNCNNWIELGGPNSLTNNGGAINSIAVDDFGNVYAAGSFVNNSGKCYVAKYDGTSWSELGGLNGLNANNAINSICIHPDGSIYAAGAFLNASGNRYVAKWDGVSWTEVGGLNALAANNDILTMIVAQNGRILAAGTFTNSFGDQYVAQFNSSTWQQYGGNLNAQGAITSICRGVGSRIYAVGNFEDSNNDIYVAYSIGSTWNELNNTSGPVFVPNATIRNVVADNYGNVFIAGDFISNGGFKYVAKWNGTSWSALGGGTGTTANDIIWSLSLNKNGDILAGGSFTNKNGANYVAVWNENIWSDISGTDGLAANNTIKSICTDNDGTIYAAGMFKNVGGKNYVAKSNCNNWTEVRSNTKLNANNTINAICKDSAGNIYAAGSFTNNLNSKIVSKWDGSQWTTIPGTFTATSNQNFNSICTDNLNNLFVAGNIVNSNGHVYVAKWNGIAWQELSDTSTLASVEAINTLCTNNQNQLFAAGNFNNAFGHKFVAQWIDSAWVELGGIDALKANGNIYSICKDNLGNIYAAGNFKNTSGNRFVAKWDGISWSELGGINALHANDTILSICVDANNRLCAAGNFKDSEGNYAVAMWNGVSWSYLGNLNSLNINSYITSLCTSSSGKLYAAGNFTNGNGSRYVLEWDGNNWNEIGGLSNLKPNGIFFALCNDEQGNTFAAGLCKNGSGNLYVGKWKNNNWTELGGTNALANIGSVGGFAGGNSIKALCTDPLGNVYVGGSISYTNNGNFIAKWDASTNTWSQLGNFSYNGGFAFALCSDPSGNIYTGGTFEINGDEYVAKYDINTNTWAPLGQLPVAFGGWIRTIKADALGNIYAAGDFINFNSGQFVAKWDVINNSWSELGDNNNLNIFSEIKDIDIDQWGNVYAVGSFNNVNSNSYVAKWSSATNIWSELGGLNSLACNNVIASVASDTLGNIYTAGFFSNDSGYIYVAKFDGNSWTELGGQNSLKSSGTVTDIIIDKQGRLFEASKNFRPEGGYTLWAYQNLYILPSVNLTVSGTACIGTPITIVANSTNGGTNPIFDFRVNGNSIQNSTNNAFTSSALNNGDVITCLITSNDSIVLIDTALSNPIIVNLITPPTPAIITANSNTVFCEGDTIVLSGNSGGLWNNGANTNSILVNTSGNYSVNNSNACGSVTSNVISITVNPLPIAATITALGNTAFCQGQNVILSGNNGGIWNDGSIAPDTLINSAGTYFVTTTNSCGSTTSNSITVTVNPLPIAAAISANGAITFCQNDSVVLSGNMNDTWNTGATAGDIVITQSGTYYLVATNGCGADTSNIITVTVHPTPVSTINFNGTDLSTSTNPTAIVEWQLNGIGIANTANLQTYTPIQSGDYAILVLDSNGCNGVSNILNVIITAINKQSGFKLNIYPNPAHNILHIDMDNKGANTQIEITDLQGQLVSAYNTTNDHFECNVENISFGVYFVKVSNEKTIQIKKIILK